MLRVEILVRRRKGVFLVEESAREHAEGFAGRAAPVPPDGSGLGEDPAPENPLAPSEVHVFEVGEVVVVETARLQELAPPDGHQASGGEEALLAGSRRGKRFDRPPDVGRERVAVESQDTVRKIVPPPGPVGEPPPDGPDVFGGPGEGRDQEPGSVRQHRRERQKLDRQIREKMAELRELAAVRRGHEDRKQPRLAHETTAHRPS